MSDQFSGELWDGISDIYGAILAHPFLTGLTDGSLSQDAFAFYVVQDALYLRGYAQALAEVGGRAPDSRITEIFARHAAGIVTVERQLHDSLLGSLGIDPALVESAEPAPTTLAYVSYVLSSIRGGSFAEGVGTVLPCYWIYWEVGKTLERATSPDPLYARWIATYASDEFGDVVRAVLAATDAVADRLRPAEREAMHRHVLTTTRYEWMFWDMGWRQEAWPV